MSVSDDRAPSWRGRLVLRLCTAIFDDFAIELYMRLWTKDDKHPSLLIGGPPPRSTCRRSRAGRSAGPLNPSYSSKSDRESCVRPKAP